MHNLSLCYLFIFKKLLYYKYIRSKHFYTYACSVKISLPEKNSGITIVSYLSNMSEIKHFNSRTTTHMATKKKAAKKKAAPKKKKAATKKKKR